MTPGRNVLWFVIVGLAVIAGIYYFFAGEGAPPPKPPAATEAPAPAAPPVAETAPIPVAPREPASSEPSPTDATAEDAARAVREIERQQDKEAEMMEAPKMPDTDMNESGDAPKEEEAPKE